MVNVKIKESSLHTPHPSPIPQGERELSNSYKWIYIPSLDGRGLREG